ncbi:zinc finger CCHC domain-containing protein, partial [Marinobacter adhaerens]
MTYKIICETARLAYRAQLDNGRWPPARSIKDKRTPPPAFGGSAVPSNSAFSAELLGKLVASADPAQAAKIFTLIQQQGTSPAKPDDVCKNCGKKGHWARECPAKKRETGTHGNRSSGRQGGTRSSSSTSGPSWKKVPPPTGSPQQKTVQGKQWSWCGKCGRWSTTHGTDTHTGKKPDTGGPGPQANTLFLDAAAFNCMVTRPVTPSDRILSALPWLIVVALTAALLYQLPLEFWLLAGALFSAHWTHLLPLGLWSALLCLVLVQPWLLPSPRHGPDPSYAYLRRRRPRPFQPYRRFRFKPRRKSYFQTRTAYSRPKLATRNHRALIDSLALLHEFAARIHMRPASGPRSRWFEEGEKGCTKPSKPGAPYVPPHRRRK